MAHDRAVRHGGVEQQRGSANRIHRAFFFAETSGGHRTGFQRGHQAAHLWRIDHASAVAPCLLRGHGAPERLGPVGLGLPLHRAAPLHHEARPEFVLQAAPAGHAQVVQLVVAARTFRAGVDPRKRVGSGAGGRRALLEQSHLSAALGQVIGNRRAHDAAADHSDASRRTGREPHRAGGQRGRGEPERGDEAATVHVTHDVFPLVPVSPAASP